jgi:hypothetical protein
MTDPRDELDELLAPPSAVRASPDLRDAVLHRTERVLARARLLRRVTTAGLFALVFVGGGAAGWVAKPEPVRVEPVPTAAEVVTVPVVVPVPAEPPALHLPVPPSPMRTEPETAGQAELLAEQADDPGEAARLYRLAGDKYLNDSQDFQNSARCYRLYVARAGDSGMSPEPADTWLLTSIKNAAFKEKYDATKTGG